MPGSEAPWTPCFPAVLTCRIPRIVGTNAGDLCILRPQKIKEEKKEIFNRPLLSTLQPRSQGPSSYRALERTGGSKMRDPGNEVEYFVPRFPNESSVQTIHEHMKMRLILINNEWQWKWGRRQNTLFHEDSFFWGKRHLAYGWRAGNLNWPISIQQAGKILVSWRQVEIRQLLSLEMARKGIYNFKNQTGWEKVKNMNHFVFLSFYFGAKNGSPALSMATRS